MLLKDLLQEVDTISIKGNMDIDIKGIAYNSQKVRPGYIFVCIKGFQADGHQYIQNAIEKGAAAVIVQTATQAEGITLISVEDSRKALAEMAANFYGHPAKRMKFIGVTGTNGKTTTTLLIKSILEFGGKTVGLVGTNENMIHTKVMPSKLTTPDSLELQELLLQMAEAGVEYVVMEVSSHSLELHRVHGITFEIGIFTNLTQEHLDFHNTMENYLEAKKKLFAVSKLAIINADDPAGKTLMESNLCPCISYSIDSPSDFKAENIRISPRGVIFDVHANQEEFQVRLGIPGRFSVYNGLAAFTACIHAGLSAENTVNGLLVAKEVKGRAETVYTLTDYTILIDYAHTPDGLVNIIKTVREFTEGRVITLFGCGGDRDPTKRPIMGEIAGGFSDFCIITSDNPRTENPMSIIRQIEAGMKKTNCEYTVIENRKAAIAYAIEQAKPNDCIILAGKGHETYQILGTEKIHFDEREIVKEILSKQR